MQAACTLDDTYRQYVDNTCRAQGVSDANAQPLPLIQVSDVETTARFHEQHLGFTRVFSSDWYVRLRAPASAVYELAVIACDHETIPGAGRGLTSGFILSVEVEDAAAGHSRPVSAGVIIPQPLRDEIFGQRHFIATDPNAILPDIITPIDPDPEWLAAQGA